MTINSNRRDIYKSMDATLLANRIISFFASPDFMLVSNLTNNHLNWQWPVYYVLTKIGVHAPFVLILWRSVCVCAQMIERRSVLRCALRSVPFNHPSVQERRSNERRSVNHWQWQSFNHHVFNAIPIALT